MLLGRPRANSADLELGGGIFDKEEDLYAFNAELGAYEIDQNSDVNVVVNEEDDPDQVDRNRGIVDEEEELAGGSGSRENHIPTQMVRAQMRIRQLAAV